MQLSSANNSISVPALTVRRADTTVEVGSGDSFAIAGLLQDTVTQNVSAVPFLGELPIDPRLAECGDAGEPIVRKYPDSPVAKAYLALAATVADAAKPITDALPEVQL